ncbi:MAG: hypothetical protein OXN89_03120 [Bryobacterales bacterium]|nr:hypothetical protein [Bryobacterales bacterium]
MARLFRDRADVENAFDELKNQWGWGVFTTQDLKPTRIMARMKALFYTWWSVYARMIDPDTRRVATTSRPMMVDRVAQVSRHGLQTTLVPTMAHSAAAGLRERFKEKARFLRELPTAPQLAKVERWRRVLERAIREYYEDWELRLTARPLLSPSNATDNHSGCAVYANVAAPECLLTAGLRFISQIGRLQGLPPAADLRGGRLGSLARPRGHCSADQAGPS